MNFFPLVSVIMPVFNGEEFLHEAIDSVLRQTFQDFELIIVDDGSTDRSVEILKKYENQDSRVKLLYSDHAGAGEARNNALKIAVGEYLCFVDSDDLFNKNMLAVFYSRAVTTNSDMVVCGYRKFDNNTKNTLWEFVPDGKFLLDERNYQDKNMNEWFSIVPPSPWGKFIKHSVVEGKEIFFQNLTSCNDFAFSYTTLSQCKTISCIKNILLYYRSGINGSISKNRGNRAENIVMAVKKLKDNLVKLDSFEKLRKTYECRCLSSLIWEINQSKGEARNKVMQAAKNNLEPSLYLKMLERIK